MVIDPIVEELHRQREEYMERFHYDFDAIIRDIKEREASNPSPFLAPPSDVRVASGSAPDAKRGARGQRW